MGKTVQLLDKNDNVVELSCTYNLDEGTQGDCMHPFEAELCVTGNLHPFFKQVFGEDGLYFLYGKMAKVVKQSLKEAVLLLGDNFNGDPWARNAGNAGHYLNILYQWALEKPDCTFRIL